MFRFQMTWKAPLFRKPLDDSLVVVLKGKAEIHQIDLVYL
jgi:hypothetical protein